MSSDDAIIEVTELHTQFGSQIVHRGVSFTIQPGTIVALIGGSGSGKSVLLRAIIGLLTPSQGTVALFGKTTSDLSEQEFQELRNRIGVLFQNGALFSALTVAENIRVPLRESSDLPPSVSDEIIGLRLALSGLSIETAKKMPSELSGGMRKRVALARALALEPELLFLDEPTSGLDPINARAFDSLIQTLARSLHITVFIVTHDLDTIEGIVDRVLVLEGGRLLADGSPKEIKKLNHPWIQEYFSTRVLPK